MKEAAVIGGLGKMGQGISLLLLTELAWTGGKKLTIVDPNEDARIPARNYFRKQLKKTAEKEIIRLRKLYKDRDIASNEECIDTFVDEALNLIEISPDISAAKNAEYIFEAALEEENFKVDLFAKLKGIAPYAYFFTNTSSIPIQRLNDKASLKGRIIGFHFYNPPVVQELMEIIPLQIGGDPELLKIALNLAEKLKKTVVISSDQPGFIGNGHFLREVKLALELADTLGAKMGREKAVQLINKVTRDDLLRPMGIFQLIEYVGHDVVKNIAKVMGISLPPLETFTDKTAGAKWKELQKSKNRRGEIEAHFNKLFREDTEEAKLARYWIEKSSGFMQELVDKKIAKNIEDVSAVLKLGFYHIYTPNEVNYAVNTLS